MQTRIQIQTQLKIQAQIGQQVDVVAGLVEWRMLTFSGGNERGKVSTYMKDRILYDDVRTVNFGPVSGAARGWMTDSSTGLRHTSSTPLYTTDMLKFSLSCSYSISLIWSTVFV